MTDYTKAYFPQVVDSSMLSDFRVCPYKFFLTYMMHWKPQFESVHLVAGGAFAKGVECARRAFYEQGANQVEAEAAGLAGLITEYGDFECPIDSPKSLTRLCEALEFYFSQYPLKRDVCVPITMPDGRRGIEFAFREELEVNHPQTGNPIIYSGRSDATVDFAGGIYNIDEKTTTQLGAKWANQWDLRSQFTSYCWAGRRMGVPIQGTIIRGVAILKTKFTTEQALTTRQGWELDRWEEMLYRDLERMLKMYHRMMDSNLPPRMVLDGACVRMGNAWDRNFEPACNDFGGCPFREVCRAKNPEGLLESSFAQRVWDPLQHKELTMEEWEQGWKVK